MLTLLLCVCWAVFSSGRRKMKELAHSYLSERWEKDEEIEEKRLTERVGERDGDGQEEIYPRPW